jgi:hypothetical protein
MGLLSRIYKSLPCSIKLHIKASEEGSKHEIQLAPCKTICGQRHDSWWDFQRKRSTFGQYKLSALSRKLQASYLTMPSLVEASDRDRISERP